MRYMNRETMVGLALGGLLWGGCTPPRAQPMAPGGSHEGAGQRTEPNTGAERTAAALENGDRVMAGGNSDGQRRWDGAGRGTAAAPVPDTAPPPSDADVARRIQAALAGEPGLSHPGLITVQVHAGAVLLGGTVSSLDEQRLAERTARRWAGNRRIDDQLRLLP